MSSTSKTQSDSNNYNRININSLPNEILLIIFNFLKWNIMEMKPHRVCRKWRDLFLNNEIKSLRIWPCNFLRMKNKDRMKFDELKYYKGFYEIVFDNTICTRSSRFIANSISLYCARNWKCIKVMNFKGCRNITWDTIQLVLKNCKSLKDLNISQCKALQWTGTNIYKGYLGSLVRNNESTNIERLSMNGYSNSGSYSSCKVTLKLRVCIKLITLEINNIFFNPIKYLFKLKNLKSLSMRRSLTSIEIFNALEMSIEKSSIDDLINNCKNLEYIDVRGCLMINFNDIRPFNKMNKEIFVKNRKRIKTLKVLYEEQQDDEIIDESIKETEESSVDETDISDDDVVLDSE